MSNIVVKYNSFEITPTPLVSHNYQFIELGGGTWGNIEDIELQCFLTGITSTGDYSKIVSVFDGNFGRLEVGDGSSNFYDWKNVVVDDINFASSKWAIGGFGSYTVKLKAFNIPSGVMDASNEYAFSQNEDGTATVTHKITAKGVKTTAGALDNAIAFVHQFTGKNPYNNCLPTFIATGKGIMMSLSENIDRLSQSYTVNEVYKYNTGSAADYIYNESLSIDESKNNDYVTLDYSIKYQGSPFNNDLAALRTEINSTNYLTKIASTFGVDSSKLYKNTVSINQESGANTIDVRMNLISGLTNDGSGYFDYMVSVDSDLVNQKSVWKVEGEFISKGPLSLRIGALNGFKTASIVSGYESYLYGLVTSSSLYAGSTSGINSRPKNFSWDENTGLAILKLSATFDDGINSNGMIDPKFDVQFEPSKWIYELQPSANIEGHYIVQDLQMKNKGKVHFSLSAGCSGNQASELTKLETVTTALSGAYIKNGFLIQDVVSSGLAEVAKECQFFSDIPNSEQLNNFKVFGSFAGNHNRPAGYKFGY